MNDKYLSVKEVSKLTKKSVYTIRKWIRDNSIPAEKFPIGSSSAHFYIKESDIPIFLRQN